jgi:exodeoxyribonuclease VII small subunit
MAKKGSPDIDLSKGFEELEEISVWFEKGETGLDEGIRKFERAMAVADALRKRLVDAENRVKEIKKKYQND